MISISKDKTDLEEIYAKHLSCLKGKVISCNEYDSERDRLRTQARNCIDRFDHLDDTQAKKEKTVRFARNVYRRYCAVRKGSPDFDNGSIRLTMSRLTDLMALEEANGLHLLRCEIPEAADKPLNNYVKNKQDVKELMNDIAVYYFRHKFKREKKAAKRKITLNKKETIVCVSKTGKCYHKLTCAHVKDKTRQIMNISNAVKLGYKPCTCIGDVQEKTGEIICDHKNAPVLKESMTVVTAFVDESCRHNPWRVYDKSLPEMQTSFSYIICRGDVGSERFITDDNTIEKNACLARWSDNTNTAAIEAIHTVLETLAIKHSFHGDVIIYTDNTGAASSWKKSEVSVGLGSLFNSVRVSFIPRERNKVADSIGRRRIFADISKETMEKVKVAMHGENIEADTIDYIEEFFPEPDRDLPKLMSELENLSTAIGYLPGQRCPVDDEAGSGKRIRSLLSSIRQGILVGAAV